MILRMPSIILKARNNGKPLVSAKKAILKEYEVTNIAYFCFIFFSFSLEKHSLMYYNIIW